jgi:hypothetical protein
MAAAPVAEQAGAQAAAPQPAEPNQYHLSGDGIAVSYYPEGIGPIIAERGPIFLVYQDANLVKSYTRDEVRSEQSQELGTIVSVTLQESIDAGSVTFSVLIPALRLTGGFDASTPVTTLGITTAHRTFLAGPGPGQQESYSVAALSGDARVGILPLLVREA